MEKDVLHEFIDLALRFAQSSGEHKTMIAEMPVDASHVILSSSHKEHNNFQKQEIDKLLAQGQKVVKIQETNDPTYWEINLINHDN